MSKFKQINFKSPIFTLFLAFIIALLFYLPNIITFNKHADISKNSNDEAKIVFLTAWEMLKEQYVDKTYNHQNWDYWPKRYLNKIKTNEDAYVAIQTMAESLNDPYTNFFSPKEVAEENINMNSKLYGIGVSVTQASKSTIITNVIENTPAQKAQLKAGDIITKINKKPIKGMELSDVVSMIRGDKGSKVHLEILRGKKSFEKDVLRDEINIKTVNSKVLDDKYGYIQITSFISKNASEEMVDSTKKLKNTKGLIIDLRGNTGGLLPNATFIADLFLKHGIIVSIVDGNGNKDSIKADNKSIMDNKPIVILINSLSASASEIFSGALKDNKRAVLIGQTTFGKGKVQQVNDLPDGSGINITVAKYLTPNGTDIDKKGIKPDVQVKFTKNDFLKNIDPQLEKAKQIINKSI